MKRILIIIIDGNPSPTRRSTPVPRFKGTERNLPHGISIHLPLLQSNTSYGWYYESNMMKTGVVLALAGTWCLGALSTVGAFSLSMSSASVGEGKTAIIAGATGYIGKSVVRESVRQGYKTIALVRDSEKVNNKQGQALYGQFFEGAEVIECDVCDPAALTKVRCVLKAEPKKTSAGKERTEQSRAFSFAFAMESAF